ncbi:MAG: DNA recombination protein RmuC [Candidatus Cloacimonetes bacterium]|nr:DNA recombination protein RmuC [Candidatus Cloacimonadota bacterium]
MVTTYILLITSTLIAFITLLYLLRLVRRPQSSGEESIKELKVSLETFDRYNREEMSRLRTELLSISMDNRRELSDSIRIQNEALSQQNQALREEMSNANNTLKQQLNADAAKNREEQKTSLNNLSENFSRRMSELNTAQQLQADTLRKSIETQMEQIRLNNETKLEQMRITVDEKLHETLEKRLGDSFKIVSERLELVHKSMGEMQTLAIGVGDLKKALTNVKTRGILGEIQLENLLEDMLTPDQYEKNFKPNKRRDEVVEFAIRLPGKDDDLESVYLPIDAKFPIEDYHRLMEAYEAGDALAVENARKNMVLRIKGCARDIRDKYLNPPQTTDFGILFLPFEGLYAEALRNIGLFEVVMREYHVILSGPTTAAALINSLQVGFQTLAIQKKSSEVWKILSAVKHEFGKFGGVLDLTQKKLQEASNTIEKASHRSRQIEKRLSKMQDMPALESKQVLDLDDVAVIEDSEEDI